MDKIRFKVFSDLPGWEAAGGGNIPSDLCDTNLKPDIVIVDETKKKLHIFELTVPLTMNIDQRHSEKSHKYTPFLTTAVKALVWNNGTLLCKIGLNRNLSF